LCEKKAVLKKYHHNIFMWWWWLKCYKWSLCVVIRFIVSYDGGVNATSGSGGIAIEKMVLPVLL